MTTRRAHDLEGKLSNALKELKSKQDMCEKLLQEHEDSEQEIMCVVQKNTLYKQQLITLDSELEASRLKCDQLQATIDGYTVCLITHEEALTHIHILEKQLHEANLNLLHYKELQSHANSEKTISLYEELVGGGNQNSSNIRDDHVTIDLTNSPSNDICPMNSVNKIKKYIKVNKIINRSHRSIKNRNKLIRSIPLHSERLSLARELELCKDTINSNNAEILDLNDQIETLRDSLNHITKKYESSCREMQEYIEAMNLIIKLGNDNMVRFDSLKNKEILSPPPSLNVAVQSEAFNKHKICTSANSLGNRIILYSDSFGIGMGSTLQHQLGKNVINNCFPGATLKLIKQKIEQECNTSSALILMLGESIGVKKKDILDLFDTLLEQSNHGHSRIIWCAFPYHKYMTEKEKKHIYLLNTLIYNLTFRHSDNFLFFDSNKFIRENILTKKISFLPNYIKLTLAKLLAFNVLHVNNSVISNITLTGNTVTSSVSTSTNNDSNLN